MEIEKLESPGEKLLIRFSDLTGTHCSLYVTEGSMGLQFDLDTNWAEFTQDQVKQLLPYLQSFAETGTLEPTTESPLQGDVNNGAVLKMLDHCQDRIQKSQVQEVKDSALCQVVVLLSQFAPVQVKEKAHKLLRTYNSEERIPLQGDISLTEQTAIIQEATEAFAILEKRIQVLLKEKASCLRQVDKLIDEISDLEEQLETMQEAGVAMAANIVDQGKRIEALQNLVRNWRAFGWTDDVSGSLEWLNLDTKSAQLLGEEQTNDPAS